ncbi:MAG: hypothetical protein JWP11_3389, partial [Frankiales bacterium]|nr:hypothetical protein [Frankiales bacterium]
GDGRLLRDRLAGRLAGALRAAGLRAAVVRELGRERGGAELAMV